MKKRTILTLSLFCVFCLLGCGIQQPQEELPTPTPILAPGEDQALPTTMIDGECRRAGL